MLFWAWRKTRFVLHAPLRRDELVRRLREHVAPGWALSSARPVLGRVGERWLWLRMRGSMMSRNSMQPYLLARLEETPAGTRLDCRFLVHPIVLAFFGMWLALLITLLGRVVLSFAKGKVGTPGWLFPLAILGGCAAVAAIAAIGRYFARDERANLLAFLREKVGAVPSDP